MIDAFVNVYKKWYSWITTFFVACIFMYILEVSQIWSFYFGVLTTPNLGFTDKLETFFDPFRVLFDFSEGLTVGGILIILVSILQGVAVNLMLYIKVFNKRELQKNATCKIGAGAPASNGIGAIVSFFGVGCVPCKTALISPLISLIFAGAAPAFAMTVIMNAILAISILLSIYAILKMLESIMEVKDVR